MNLKKEQQRKVSTHTIKLCPLPPEKLLEIHPILLGLLFSVEMDMFGIPNRIDFTSLVQCPAFSINP
jgi:hypothetical protein